MKQIIYFIALLIISSCTASTSKIDASKEDGLRNPSGIEENTKLSSNIKGYIDLVTTKVQGWVCHKGESQSIKFKIFVGGPLGQGKEVGTYLADQGNEAAVNAACGTSKSNHRFSIDLPKNILLEMQGQPVYVYGYDVKNGFPGLLSLNGKFVTPSDRPSKSGQINYKEQQLIGDLGFTNGFKILNVNGEEIYTNRLPGKNLSLPTWDIAQWGTVENIPNVARIEDKYYIWYNNYKFLKVGYTEESKTEVIFGIDSNAEYSGIYRKSSDARTWPHLLIQQSIATLENKHLYRPLSQATKIVLNLDVQLLRSENIKKSGYSSSYHASQFVLYFTLQNLNPSSPDYKKYVWFGVPLYDDREQFIPSAAFIDKATQSLIYTPSGREFLSTSMHDMKPKHINKDLLPYMKQAIEYANKKGIFSSKDLNDFYIGHTNMGFEVPGLAMVQVWTKNFSLIQYNR